MHTLTKTLHILLATAILSTMTLSAMAQERTARDRGTARESTRGNDVSYEFLDDPLAAGNFGPTGGGIVVRKRSMRSLLIRPRTQFITEMLKSVENL
jgi:hypothetical protein